jgi:hypothetical protein
MINDDGEVKITVPDAPDLANHTMNVKVFVLHGSTTRCATRPGARRVSTLLSALISSELSFRASSVAPRGRDLFGHRRMHRASITRDKAEGSPWPCFSGDSGNNTFTGHVRWRCLLYGSRRGRQLSPASAATISSISSLHFRPADRIDGGDGVDHVYLRGIYQLPTETRLRSDLRTSPASNSWYLASAHGGAFKYDMPRRRQCRRCRADARDNSATGGGSGEFQFDGSTEMKETSHSIFSRFADDLTLVLGAGDDQVACAGRWVV